MRKVFNQPYTKKRAITCWFGNPPKDIFKYDVIRIKFGDCEKCGGIIYMTPDEASTAIRALSAGLSHYLVRNDKCARSK